MSNMTPSLQNKLAAKVQENDSAIGLFSEGMQECAFCKENMKHDKSLK